MTEKATAPKATKEKKVDAQAAAAKAAEAAKKAADLKAKKEADAAKRKEEREANKARRAEEAAAEKAKKDAEKAKKEADKAAAKAAREANKQPIQNDVRRPGPNGKTGAAWALMDKMSAEKKAPVASGDLLKVALEKGMNENMVRAQYASWRKFHGITGRIPKAETKAEAK